MYKKHLTLTIGLVLGMSSLAQARFCFDDPFFDMPCDMSWADHMVDALVSARHKAFNRFAGPSKVEREAMKAAHEKLAAITHEIDEKDGVATISFKGFEGLRKDDVKVVKKDDGWLGTITLPEGRVEFFISRFGVQVATRIELKKEEKIVPANAVPANAVPANAVPAKHAPAKASKTANADKKEKEEPSPKSVERLFYTSTTTRRSAFFTSAVDLSTLKAEPVTPTAFTLTVKKEKEEVLPIS